MKIQTNSTFFQLIYHYTSGTKIGDSSEYVRRRGDEGADNEFRYSVMILPSPKCDLDASLRLLLALGLG